MTVGIRYLSRSACLFNISYVYSTRRQKQRKEKQQIDRGQNLQSNRDIQLTSARSWFREISE